MSDFHGLSTAVLENEYIRLEYLTTAGPRLIRLSYQGSPNLLADAYDVSLNMTHEGYSLLGGHRLWISPEVPEKTYIPDNSGVRVMEIPNGVELTGASEEGSRVRKRVKVELEARRPVLQLVHTIVNEDLAAVTISPWAISMFRQGGTVILPQPDGNADPNGLLNNRLIALWPYTRIADARLILRDDFILVHATPNLPALKLGYYNTAGWLAYWIDGILFRKSFVVHPGTTYPDGGCNSEVFCNDRFVELETLGSLTALLPGEEAVLTETWDLRASLDAPFIPNALRDLLG